MRRREREHPHLRHLRRLQVPGALASHSDPKKASRPFDKARNGIVVSEGGCLFVLERLDDALARGARIYAEIAGYCVNSDGERLRSSRTPRVRPSASGRRSPAPGPDLRAST